jgi:hypothetical protein
MSCQTLAAKVWPEPKDPSSKLDYEVDFTDALSRKWGASDKSRALAIFIRAPNGYDFECTTAGRSGVSEPRWTKTLASTVPDGSAVWTCRASSTSSLVTTIAGTPTWTCDDAALVFSDTSVSGQIAKAWIAGGVDGQDYTVLVTATCADAEGSTIAKPCILEVRRATRTCCA